MVNILKIVYLMFRLDFSHHEGMNEINEEIKKYDIMSAI